MDLLDARADHVDVKLELLPHLLLLVRAATALRESVVEQLLDLEEELGAELEVALGLVFVPVAVEALHSEVPGVRHHPLEVVEVQAGFFVGLLPADREGLGAVASHGLQGLVDEPAGLGEEGVLVGM